MKNVATYLLLIVASGMTCACTSYGPHSVVFTPHFQNAEHRTKAVFTERKEACATGVFHIFWLGDSSLETAMPDVDPIGDTALAYVIVDIVRKNYFIWSKVCTEVKSYYVKTPPRTENATSGIEGSSQSGGRNSGNETKSIELPISFSNYSRPKYLARTISFNDEITAEKTAMLKSAMNTEVWVKTTTGRTYLGTLVQAGNMYLQITEDTGNKITIELLDVKTVAFQSGPNSVEVSISSERAGKCSSACAKLAHAHQSLDSSGIKALAMTCVRFCRSKLGQDILDCVEESDNDEQMRECSELMKIGI